MITILGSGLSGIGAAKLALENSKQVAILDEADISPDDIRVRLPKSDQLQITGNWKHGFPGETTQIIISPGIPPSASIYRAAVVTGIPIASELAYAADNCRVPLLAVTGTNGKTTTVELLTHLLQALNVRTMSAGNIGHTLSEAVLRQDLVDCLVVEVSSFQLEQAPDFSPTCAALLNVTSDHQDRYPTFADYRETKLHVFAQLSSIDQMILNHNLLPFWPYKEMPTTFSAACPEADFHLSAGCICRNDKSIIPVSELQLIGSHNHENVMAALAMLQAYLGSADVLWQPELRKALHSFRPAEHRLEIVAEENGIRYVNDSKATNPDAVAVALSSIGGDHNVCLILGGLDKDMDFASLRTYARFVKHAWITGECRDKISHALADTIPHTLCADFDDAFNASISSAAAGDVVMLSPGCASMDQFKNYQERGKHFKELISKHLPPKK